MISPAAEEGHSKPIEIGQAMWLQLEDTFHFVARENNIVGHKELAQLWGGFIAAMTGSVLRDLGADDMIVLLTACMNSAEKVAIQSKMRGTLMPVKS